MRVARSRFDVTAVPFGLSLLVVYLFLWGQEFALADLCLRVHALSRHEKSRD